jgi:hypothetical protein
VTPGSLLFVLGGLVGGIVLGAGLTIVFEVLDPRLRRAKDFEEAAGLPVIGGFRREVQPRRQHWFLNKKSGFPLRTPAFCSVSKGQRRLGEKEYRAPSVTPGVALRVRTQASPSCREYRLRDLRRRPTSTRTRRLPLLVRRKQFVAWRLIMRIGY